MPSRSSLLARAPRQPSARFRPPVQAAVLAAATAFALAGCSPVVSIENADVPQWQATALPSAPGAVLEDAGKILNRDRIIREAADVPAGRYILTATCEGGGKAFFAVSLDGTMLADAGAACNGSRETTRITLPKAGALEISTSSVDAPLIYAYRLAPEG
ncbi:hypothetical protein D7Z96_19025 [Pseudarthrobacter phenanthrenivorans]|uniref:Uncharacterized protein n=1 Tax=Pseudarthrobacter phenanthrenivorans TaxID=361575 RepID=A0A3B0FBI6_PSEPS|nr:hypothetical protein [Pseudarthrobacter phenanthrenivorans]RKO20303.1 hypothetical protein D7Z96_19025 [Pseudarthrobacter phenanthrenivorans]TPV52370.1 hypothetical protein FJ661_03415 [Pseudarthrobacter phenanthrenivorans]